MPKEEQKQLDYNRYLTKKLSELSERMRSLEGRVDILKQKIDSIDRNSINKTNELKEEITRDKSDIRKVRGDVIEVQDGMKFVLSELSETAKKRELAILSKYVDLIDPTRFLSKEEVIKIIKDNKKG